MTSDIRFARLSTIPPQTIADHMSDPRVVAHMPLVTEPWTEATARAFIAAKEACWTRDGLGHWAFLCDGRYVGWGGFQKEGDAWDYGLVLTADAFGLGRRITAQALAFAKAESCIATVMFLLPPTRRHLGALDRLGARFCGTITHDGASFLKYELATGQD